MINYSYYKCACCRQTLKYDVECIKEKPEYCSECKYTIEQIQHNYDKNIKKLSNALKSALCHADYFSEQLEMARCLEPDEKSRCDQLHKAREALKMENIEFKSIDWLTSTDNKDVVQILKDHWWVVNEQNQVLFYRGITPQCNANENLAESIRNKLYPNMKLLFIPVAFVPWED